MGDSSLPTSVGAYENERLKELADQPNTTVYTVNHDAKHDPWKPKRLKRVIERLSSRVREFAPEVDDFTLRKQCLDDEEILNFQRDHPKTYWMLTDRALANNPKAHAAVVAMLGIHSQLRSGNLSEQEADAAATSAVMNALK